MAVIFYWPWVFVKGKVEAMLGAARSVFDFGLKKAAGVGPDITLPARKW